MLMLLSLNQDLDDISGNRALNFPYILRKGELKYCSSDSLSEDEIFVSFVLGVNLLIRVNEKISRIRRTISAI